MTDCPETRRRYAQRCCLFCMAALLFLVPGLAPAATVIGNGSLTIGLDAAGRLLACRWPAPGTPEYAPDAGNGGWAIALSQRTEWPAAPDSGWTHEELASPHPGAWQTRMTSPDGTLEFELVAAVHPIRDVLAIRATLRGIAAPVVLGWQAVPRFVARPVTGIPGLAERWARGDETPQRPVWQCSAATRGEVFEVTTQPVAGDQVAEILLVFGGGNAGPGVLLEDVKAQGFDRIAADAEAYWRARTAALPNALQPMTSALRMLILATDRSGGGVVENILGEPRLGVVTGRTTAWAAWAHEIAGDPATASRALRFLARAVVHQARPGIPAGLLPSRLYTDGRPAAPYALRDLDGLCWFLGACARHARLRTDAERTVFLEGVEGAVIAGGDLIADWTLGPNGPPLPSYQPLQASDGESIATHLLMITGLHAAISVRILQGQLPNPDWEYRFDALLARVLLARQEGGRPLALDPVLAYWLRSCLALDEAPRLAGLRAMPVSVGGLVSRLDAVPCPAPAGVAGVGATEAAAITVVCTQAN